MSMHPDLRSSLLVYQVLGLALVIVGAVPLYPNRPRARRATVGSDCRWSRYACGGLGRSHPHTPLVS